jgi:hypothetical protein
LVPLRIPAIDATGIIQALTHAVDVAIRVPKHETAERASGEVCGRPALEAWPVIELQQELGFGNLCIQIIAGAIETLDEGFASRSPVDISATAAVHDVQSVKPHLDHHAPSPDPPLGDGGMVPYPPERPIGEPPQAIYPATCRFSINIPMQGRFGNSPD